MSQLNYYETKSFWWARQSRFVVTGMFCMSVCWILDPDHQFLAGMGKGTSPIWLHKHLIWVEELSSGPGMMKSCSYIIEQLQSNKAQRGANLQLSAWLSWSLPTVPSSLCPSSVKFAFRFLPKIKPKWYHNLGSLINWRSKLKVLNPYVHTSRSIYSLCKLTETVVSCLRLAAVVI